MGDEKERRNQPAEESAEPRATTPPARRGDDPGALGRVLSPSRPWAGEQPPVAPPPPVARPLDRTDIPVPSHEEVILQAIAEDDVDHGDFGFDIGPTAKGRLRRVFRRGGGAPEPFEKTDIAGPPTLQPKLRIDEATLGAAQQNPPRVEPTPTVFAAAPVPPSASEGPASAEGPVTGATQALAVPWSQPSYNDPHSDPHSDTHSDPHSDPYSDPHSDPHSGPGYATDSSTDARSDAPSDLPVAGPATRIDELGTWTPSGTSEPVLLDPSRPPPATTPELPAAVLNPTPVPPEPTPEPAPAAPAAPAQPRWSQAARPADYIAAGQIETEVGKFSYAPDGEFSAWAAAGSADPAHSDEAARRRRLFRRNTDEETTGPESHASASDSANVGMSSAVAPGPSSELSPEPSGYRADSAPSIGSEVVSPAPAVTSEEPRVEEPHRRRIFRRGHGEDDHPATDVSADESIVDAPVPPQTGFVEPSGAQAPTSAPAEPAQTLSLPPLAPPAQRLSDALQLSDRLAEVERRAELLAQRLEQSAREAEQRYLDMIGSHDLSAPRPPLATPTTPPARPVEPSAEAVPETASAPAVEPEAPEVHETHDAEDAVTASSTLPAEDVENLTPFRPWDEVPSRPVPVTLPEAPPDPELSRPKPTRSARPEGEPEPDSPEDEVGIDSSIARIPTEEAHEAIDQSDALAQPSPAASTEAEVSEPAVESVAEAAPVDIDDPSVDEFEAAEFHRPEPEVPAPSEQPGEAEPETVPEPEQQPTRAERREARRAARSAAVRPRHAVPPIGGPEVGTPEAAPGEGASATEVDGADEGAGLLRRAVSWVMTQDGEQTERADTTTDGPASGSSGVVTPTGTSTAGADLARRLSSYDLTSPFPEEEAQRRRLFKRHKAAEPTPEPLVENADPQPLEALRPTVQWEVVAKEQAVTRALRAGMPVPEDLAASLAAARAQAQLERSAGPKAEVDEPDTSQQVDESDPLLLEPPEAIAASARPGGTVEIGTPAPEPEPADAETVAEPEAHEPEADEPVAHEPEPPAPGGDAGPGTGETPADESPVDEVPSSGAPVGDVQAEVPPVRRRPKPYRSPDAQATEPRSLAATEPVPVLVASGAAAALTAAESPVLVAPGAAAAAVSVVKTDPFVDPQRPKSFLERTNAEDDAEAAREASATKVSAPLGRKADIRGATAKPVRRRAPGWLRFAAVVVVAVLLAFGLRSYVVAPYYIPSPSMEPTLHGCTGCNNDHVLVDKLSYRLHSVHRGDVVVFNLPKTWQGITDKVLIKRVIGLPGDVLTLKNGVVYVNGQQLQEPYVKNCGGVTTTLGPTNTTITTAAKVPPDDYFVMGDNRCQSDDSRTNGPIPKSSIIGRAFVIIWPLGRIHDL